MESYHFKLFESFSDLSADQWEPLQDPNYPFLDYSFLRCLEETDCLGERTGWFPQIYTVWCKDRLVGVLPAFVKSNSYGEYIFDWDWAYAYRQLGLPYYPKLVVAVPFTPTTGPRWLCHHDFESKSISAMLIDHLIHQRRPCGQLLKSSSVISR